MRRDLPLRQGRSPGGRGRARRGGGPALPRIDAVTRARAALLPPAAIAHYKVTLSPDPPKGPADPRYADCNAGPLEVWRATGPTRWRALQPVSGNPACGTLDLSQGLGPVTAPRFEVSYAEGRTEMYVPASGARVSISARFGDYERIPLTRGNARLLEIDAPPDTRIVERTLGQIKDP